MDKGMGVIGVIKREEARVSRKSPYRVAAHQKISLQTRVFGRIVNSAEIHE
jgi:hypothetical protein